MNFSNLPLFQDQIHQTYARRGDGRGAALLIHGFPGTPAEMRPLAEALHAQGWSVQAPLLPGFGPNIDQLFVQRKEDWLAEVLAAQALLWADHERVLLVGYSMGGAIALNVAAQSPPDGLILLAPFWRVGTGLYRLIWQGLRRLGPEFQPFKRLDFANSEVRLAFGDMLGNVDLDDPAVQELLRELRVPVRLVDEVFALGQAARTAATHIHAPTLVIQGDADPTIAPAATHELLRAMPASARYVEVKMGHELVKGETAVFPQVRQAVLAFAGRVAIGNP